MQQPNDKNPLDSTQISSLQQTKTNARKRLQKNFGLFLKQVGQILEEEEDVDQEFYKDFQLCLSFFQMMTITSRNQEIKDDQQIEAKIKDKSKEEPKSVDAQSQETFIQFSYLFEDFSGTLTEALDLLNLEAEAHGYKFKLGSVSSKEQTKNAYAYIYCKERVRTPLQTTESSQDSNKGQKKKVKSKQKSPSHQRCMAYYGFKFQTMKNGLKIFTYHSESALHNHVPKIYQEITPSMISQMLNLGAKSLFQKL